MHKINSPLIAINCHGGVGRTGLTALCYDLLKEVDAQVKAGRKLHEVEINPAEMLMQLRHQGRDMLHQEPAFTQAGTVVSECAECLHREISDQVMVAKK